MCFSVISVAFPELEMSNVSKRYVYKGYWAVEKNRRAFLEKLALKLGRTGLIPFIYSFKTSKNFPTGTMSAKFSLLCMEGAACCIIMVDL